MKHERAAQAYAADPTKSDRLIAAEIGVDKTTVMRARKATGANAPVEDDQPTEPAKRIGRDGKSTKLTDLDLRTVRAAAVTAGGTPIGGSAKTYKRGATT